MELLNGGESRAMGTFNHYLLLSYDILTFYRMLEYRVTRGIYIFSKQHPYMLKHIRMLLVPRNIFYLSFPFFSSIIVKSSADTPTGVGSPKPSRTTIKSPPIDSAISAINIKIHFRVRSESD